VLAPELDELGPLGTGSFAGSATVKVAAGSLELRQRLLKRALDVTLSVLVLAMTAPLLLIVAVAIMIDSQGPVFFMQQRVGRGNELFRMIKFRSMRVDASDRDGARSTGRGDDRVTRVGAFIRATSIDELPQLFNVLSGTMSIVGPRPHALGSLAGDALFWDIDERYWHRHACKPGLTGLAQVRGLRGATHHRTDLINRLQADLEYIAGWTIWKDFAILLATMRVLIHKNAY
jgi:lipopolysaccharide/colanic/teichoic acid biosynthesis glycosyltransferase